MSEKAFEKIASGLRELLQHVREGDLITLTRVSPAIREVINAQSRFQAPSNQSAYVAPVEGRQKPALQ